MSSEKIYTTYLLGAGASANALPMVIDMHDRMTQFLAVMRAKVGDQHGWDPLFDMIKYSREYGTPDTYAKILKLMGDRKYERFKDLISLFMLFEQMPFDWDEFNKFPSIDKELLGKSLRTLDYRYAQFIASVFDTVHLSSLDNSKIRIITWNYDIQFEMLLSTILKLKHPEVMKLTAWKIEHAEQAMDTTKGFITRVNGCCDFALDKENKDYLFKPSMSLDEFSKFFERVIFSGRTSYFNHLHFAWENDESSLPYWSRLRANQILSKTHQLVIIGYSFPNYNRLVDKGIISGFQGKVHLQGNGNLDQIEERLKSIVHSTSKGRIKQVNYSDQFFIPDDILV
ncbi:MAG: hypothetical protein ACKVOR_06965 [Flavobacteriales bacterium]